MNRSHMRFSRSRAALVTMAAAFTIFGASAGGAHASKEVDSFWGGSFGSLGGQFAAPDDVAVNEGTGQVYVVEAHRVQRLSSDGLFERAWGGDVVTGGSSGYEICTVVAQCKGGMSGSGKGLFSGASGIAVDQGDGSVYVLDQANDRVQKFDADGNFVLMFGDEVNASTSGDICTEASGDSCQEGNGGAGSGAIEGSSGNTGLGARLAVDPTTGDVYVGDIGNRRVAHFEPDGSFVRAWGWDVVPPGGPGDVLGSNERQTISLNFAGGNFGLVFDGQATSPIPAGATAAQLQGSLEALPNISPGDVTVTGGSGGPWTVEFTGAYAGHDVPPLGSSKYFRVLTVTGATGGTVSVGLQLYRNNVETHRTATFSYDASVAQVEAAFKKVVQDDGYDAQVKVEGPPGGPWGFEIIEGKDVVGAFDASAAQLIGEGATAVVSNKAKVLTESTGGSFEICTSVCRAGVYSVGDEGESPNNGRFFEAAPDQIEVDAAGVVYAADRFASGRVMRFDSTAGTAGALLLPPLTAPSLATDGAGIGVTVGLAFDSTNDDLFVARRPAPLSAGAALRIQQFDTGSLALVDVHPTVTEIAADSSAAIGLDPSLGRIYVPHIDGLAACGNCHGLFVLDDDGAAPPQAELGGVSGLTAHEATLQGSVDPQGGASYRFELSTDGGESWAPVGEEEPYLSGYPGPIAVTAELTELEANRTYEARLVATKPTGRSSELVDVSSPQSFTTDVIPPDVETFYPRNHESLPATESSPASARAVFAGRLNANNLPTTYHFEYGETTAYGQQAPVPSGTKTGGKPGVVTTGVDGLEPETTYHYRLVATNSAGTSLGNDVAFRTRKALPAVERGLEMVTPPFKVTRGTVANGVLGANRLIGGPSLDGETMRWKLHFFPLLEETRSPFNGDELVLRRTPSGWTMESLLTLPLLPEFPTRLIDSTMVGGSGDLEVGAWMIGAFSKEAALLPNESDVPLNFYTRRDGTGSEGWSGWLSNVATQQVPGRGDILSDTALFNDDGSWMVRWGDYRKLLGDTAIADPSATQFSGTDGGRTIYRQQEPPAGPRDLVNGCTGTVAQASATQIPSRIGNGSSTDTLGTQSCAKNAVVSRRGAIVGANHVGSSHSGHEFELLGPSATAMSEKGDRVYFTSPDPGAPTTPKTGCLNSTTLPAQTIATGANTNCPPQLYLRHYDASGVATVRWISRPAAGMPTQQIGLLGPAVFQGASRDGNTVYFKTSSPLTADDPNGTGSPGPVTTGTASSSSWDLYRYEVPGNPVSEPGALTRVTGGPTGTADPGTNGLMGGAARFISDDGKRAYFVTEEPISAADQVPPTGGATVPGGQGRNLYLFDANEQGADRWRFIARLPFGNDSNNSFGYNACASYFSIPADDSGAKAGTGAQDFDLEGIGEGSCVRGTSDGEAIVFITQGQLTADDTDSVADVYLYDAGDDELVRVTAPRGNDVSYACQQQRGSGEEALTIVACRGQLIGWMKHNGAGGTNEFSRGWGGDRYMNISKGADGAISVFFESRAPLLAEDHNANHWDVYEWREGVLSLISRGEPGHHSYFSGNSVDGRDVFFVTSDRIDPREIDDGDYDIYDARIGGGFEYVPPPEPCAVLALECESAATPPPAIPTGATIGGSGGNVSEPLRRRRCAKGKVRRRGRCLKRRASGHRQKATPRKRGRR